MTNVTKQRYGEDSRQRPQENKKVWEGVEDLFERRLVKAVVFDRRYSGLESVPEAMKDMAARKVWGKAIICVAQSSTAASL